MQNSLVPDQAPRSGLTKWHACRSDFKLFDTLMVFLKEFFIKMILKKKSRRQKCMQNYPVSKDLHIVLRQTDHFQSFFFRPPDPKSEKKNPVNQLITKFWPYPITQTSPPYIQNMNHHWAHSHCVGFVVLWPLCRYMYSSAVEIPSSNCSTWSNFIKNKLEIAIYLSLDMFKIR